MSTRTRQRTCAIRPEAKAVFDEARALVESIINAVRLNAARAVDHAKRAAAFDAAQRTEPEMSWCQDAMGHLRSARKYLERARRAGRRGR